MGLQQTSQSSIYVCRRTDMSNTIEISSQQYGQVKKYSMSWAQRLGHGFFIHAVSGFISHFRLQFRRRTALRANQLLNLFQGLRQARYQSIWLTSFETGLGFLCIALESPNTGDKLDSGKAAPHLFADHARRR